MVKAMARRPVHLSPGERKIISVFRLPRPSAVRQIEADVKWPDGRPAERVDVWAEIGDQAAAHGKTGGNGVARFEVIEGVRYTVEAKVWVGDGDHREVARSGASELVPTGEPVRLSLVLNKRTRGYR